MRLKPLNKWEKEVQESLLKDEKAVIKQLEKEYKTALNEVNKKLENYTLRIENNIDDLSAFHQMKYQIAVKKQINESLNALQSNNYKTINDYLNGCYENSYIGTFYNLQKQGVPLIIPFDKADTVRAVTLNSKISEGLYKHLGIDTDKLKKDIATEVTRGITTGETWINTAQRLEQRGAIPLHNAVRIARTEGHRIQINSNMDAMKKAKEKGANIVKQWDATLDGNTRPTHRQLDGQTAEIDKPFKYSGGEVYAPSQFGDPAQDCNCRCCLLQRAKWGLDNETFTKMNGNTGELVNFSKDSYNEFKKDFWKQCEVIKSTPTPAFEFKNFNKLKDAEKFAKDVLKIKTVDFKGIDVKVANAMNKSLTDAMNYCPKVVENMAYYGTAQGRTQLLRPMIVDYYKKELSYSYGGTLSPNRLDELAKDYASRVIHKVPQNVLAISYSTPNKESIWYETMNKFKGIGVNKNYGKDAETFEKNLQWCVKTKFHPIGCENLKSVFDHELGHQIDGFYNIREKPEIIELYHSLTKDEIKEQLSEYGSKKIGEFIAEGYAEYVNNPNPRPIAKTIGNIIESEVVKKK